MSQMTLEQVIAEVKSLTPAEKIELHRLLEELIEQEEDRLDLEDALQAEAEAEARGEKPVPWDEVKKGLGL
jgi:hypothetical protein